jgi:transcriptional regulator with XRE-family HTH domain
MNNMLHQRFCENLRRVMADKAVTQAELARRLGVSSVHVCQLIAGRNVPSLEKVEQVSKALGLDPEELLSPVEEKIPV